MLLGRRTALAATAAALVLATLLVRPALAADRESGRLSCAAGQVVVITERTSAGLTIISFDTIRRVIRKQDWSTTTTNIGRRSTTWSVSTTGAMDHQVTGAACEPSLPKG